MASAAIRPVSEKFTRVPNAFIENQHLFKLPASRALALIAFRSEQDAARWHHKITDTHWESWTGLGVRAKELACKELQGFGLEISGRGDEAKFSWNWDRWHEAITEKHQGEYDPKRKERESKAVAAKAGAKVHEECRDHGCAMLRAGQCPSSTAEAATGSKPTSVLFLPKLAQPVTQTPDQTEKKWAKSMAAMRDGFASAGVELLLKLLAVIWSIVGCEDVSDYILAESIKTAYAESRGRWNSPVLLITHVPNVLKGWMARGQPMDDTGDDDTARPILKPTAAAKPKPKRARDLI